ncbi:MAG: thioredoxin family protein [Roseivirga sp.]|nr:thioredoxin family protein [Roseivirga sp.]
MAVTIVDDSNFKQELADNQKVVVKYFAGWCGSCRLFAPKYKRLSNDERFEGVTFLDVNAEQSPEARKAGEVKNLPTFAIFQNGELLESLASNKEDQVVSLIEKLN